MFERYLTGGPRHGSAAEQMQMQMVDGLSAVGAGVDDDAISASEACVAGYLRRLREQMPEEGGVLFFGVCLRGDVLPGNDQEMGGRLGIDIGEDDAAFVLILSIGRNSAGDDLAEQAVRRHGRVTQLEGPLFYR